jgi:hypothetical protein
MRKVHLLKCSIIIFVLFLMSQITPAQGGYKGIVPMVSTCNDVKLILGGECGNAEERIRLKDETIKINYSTEECQSFFGKKWNVPIGTVLRIARFFRDPPTLDELGITIDESEYNKSYTDVPSQIIYEKKGGGLTMIVSNNYVSDIAYTPTSEDDSKVCKCKK